MNQGNIVRTRHFEAYSEDGNVRAGYTAPKGKVFVLLILGLEDHPYPTPGDPPFRHDAMLRALGWQFNPPAELSQAALAAQEKPEAEHGAHMP